MKKQNILYEYITQGINEQIKDTKLEHPDFSAKGVSDGYHTFGELYDFRKMYNAALFNEWASDHMFVKAGMARGLSFLHNPPAKYDVHKSWKHHDGEYCFGSEKEWFIVSAMLPTGLISNHYKAADWDLFNVPVVEKAKYEFDGHTGKDVLERLHISNSQ